MKSNYLNLILLLLCFSLSACRRSEHYYEEAEALFQKGLGFRTVKNTEAAAVAFSQALLTLNHCDTSKIEAKRLLGQLDDNLGAMYWKHGLKDDALVLHLDAVSIFSQLDDQALLMKALRNTGRVSSSLGRTEDAGNYYRAALQIAKTLNDKDFINETYMEMAHDLYLECGEYEKAIETAKEAFSEEVDTCFCYLVIGLAHYYLENNDQALMYLEKAVQSNKASLRMSAYQGLYYIHVANDDYEDALEAHELYDENMIQADKEFNTREMQRIKSDYDLQLQKYSIQAEQHIKNLRYYILLGLLLAVFILTLLLMHQKSLKGRLKVEETKNQMETAMKRNKVYVTALALTEQVTASTLDFELKENDWDDFMELVDVVYNGFTKKLLAKYPSLTKGDLQICCLTKQGFSNQVISILMNQQTASYARRKSRIKQEKMSGSGDDRSFEEIISQF